jgi:hemerythrin
MGKILEWKKIMSVGMEELDIQNKELINIINSIYSLEKNENSENLKKIFSRLVNYIKYHFETEERYLKIFNYPDIENHVLEHRYIMHKLNLFNNNEFNADNAFKLLGFLTGWFNTHIMFSDKQYTSFLTYNSRSSKHKKLIHPH